MTPIQPPKSAATGTYVPVAKPCACHATDAEIVARLAICGGCSMRREMLCGSLHRPVYECTKKGQCPSGLFGKALPVPDTAIIITCGPGLEAWLPGAVKSAIGQAREVVVVFDRCDPIEIHHAARVTAIDAGNVQTARRAGVAATTAPTVLFLDADNTIPEGFVAGAAQSLVSASQHDGRVAGAYPAIQYFSEIGKRLDLLNPPEWDRVKWEQANFVDASTLFWRHALDVAWTGTVDHSRLEDWDMVRQIVEAGYTLTRSYGPPLRYTRRAESMTAVQHAKTYELLYRLDETPVTVFVALSGAKRAWAWPRLFNWLQGVAKPHRIVLAVDTTDDAYWERVRYQAGCLSKCEDVRIYRTRPAVEGLADADRLTHEKAVNYAVARIYNRAIQEMGTSWGLFIEDDVLPRQSPRDLIASLMGGVDAQTAAVSGVYHSRFLGTHASYMGGDGKALQFTTDAMIAKRPEEYIPIGGSGFGCLLARINVLRKFPLSITPAEPWYDPRLFKALHQAGYVTKLAVKSRCDHRSENS